MFEWLEEELAAIKTCKFHVVDGPADAELRKAIDQTSLSAPRAYKEFALRFGNSSLYRQDGFSLYWLTLFASMREVDSEADGKLLWFGKNDMCPAYFRADLLRGEKDSPVFEWIGAGGYLRRTADGFETWIERCRQRARRKYTKRRWKEILLGPPPFSDAEKRIVHARKKYRWRKVGVAENGDVQFKVRNGSDTILPFLSIQIRGAIDGGVWLPVGHIKPGETAIVEQDCYKDQVSPDEIELFEEPLMPEDRETCWEFRDLS